MKRDNNAICRGDDVYAYTLKFVSTMMKPLAVPVLDDRDDPRVALVAESVVLESEVSVVARRVG